MLTAVPLGWPRAAVISGTGTAAMLVQAEVVPT